jgi:hypothetical protein
VYPKVSGLSRQRNIQHTSTTTDSQNSDTTATSGRELYHLQFSLQAASPETFGYTLILLFYIINDIIIFADSIEFNYNIKF